MQVFGLITHLKGKPLYLGHMDGDAYHLSVFCNKEGVPYFPEQLASAGITDNDVAELFQVGAGHIAELLGKSVDQIGLRLTAGEPPAIVDFKKK